MVYVSCVWLLVGVCVCGGLGVCSVCYKCVLHVLGERFVCGTCVVCVAYVHSVCVVIVW